MQLPKPVITQYNQARTGTYKGVVCHAPFVSLNFEQNGNIRACCYNTKDILGKWPEQSIREIWHGEKADKLRNHILENDLGGGCTECGNMLIAGNYQGVRAKFFDEYSPNNISSRIHYFRRKVSGHINYPKVLEFELSNECNLECVMCNGYFSSSIRKNREKLPPLHSPYNDAFVKELEEFIPHITDAKFLGGEPFMIDIYLKIWETILRINPNVRIHITTNGTFLNNRIKELLEGLKAGIILSIDSVNKETYSKIRVNGNFDKVMENLDYLMDYTQRKKTFISMAASPITYNWRELPEMLSFCLERNIALYFNVVFTPEELSLKEQPIDYLKEVIDWLQKNPAPEKQGNPLSPRNLSISAYNDFLSLLKGWLETREAQLAMKDNRLHTIQNKLHVESFEIQSVSWSKESLLKYLFQLTEIHKKGFFEEEEKLQQQLGALLIAAPKENLEEVFETYIDFYIQYCSIKNETADKSKAASLAALIGNNPERENILKQTSQVPPLKIGGLFYSRSIVELSNDLKIFFG